MKKLAGKTALVTGGSSGIGLATAKLFRDEGARVAITGRDPARLESARQALGSDVLAFCSDAGRVAEIESLMTEVGERFGRLDILFLNAGIWKPVSIEEATEAQFDETMDINFKGAYFAIQKALPIFSEQAAVIIHSSIHNRKGSPNYSIYAASKAALRSLTQSMGLALIGRGVRVNAICAGPIDTPMFYRGGMAAEVIRPKLDAVAQKSPSKRLGTADEVAKLVLFLASDDASYLVGEEIVIDGGLSLL